MADLWVASEGKQRLGGVMGSAGTVTPAGRVHAVERESGEVLCGIPLDMLEAFPKVSWARLGTAIRCRRCVAAAAAL